VIGEVPAAMFFYAAILIWYKTVVPKADKSKLSGLIFAGLFLGLAVLTKNQLFLLFPAWLLMWLLNHFYYKQLRHRDFLLPFGIALVTVLAWYVGQVLLFPEGEQLASANLSEWSGSLDRGILTFSMPRMMDALKFLTGQDAFYGWIFPSVLYVGIRSIKKTRANVVYGLLVVVTLAWIAWFAALSVGWPRYAFIPFTLAALFTALIFHDITDGYSLQWSEIKSIFTTGEIQPHVVAKIAFLALLVIIAGRSLQGRVIDIVQNSDDTPQQISAYIRANVPADTPIETYDPEICFMAEHACSMPPGDILNIAIKHIWYQEQPPYTYYDFYEVGQPEYLLIGEFGEWTQVYDPDSVAEHYVLDESIGAYNLYRKK
jgi:hypothetical protein